MAFKCNCRVIARVSVLQVFVVLMLVFVCCVVVKWFKYHSGPFVIDLYILCINACNVTGLFLFCLLKILTGNCVNILPKTFLLTFNRQRGWDLPATVFPRTGHRGSPSWSRDWSHITGHITTTQEQQLSHGKINLLACSFHHSCPFLCSHNVFSKLNNHVAFFVVTCTEFKTL